MFNLNDLKPDRHVRPLSPSRLSALSQLFLQLPVQVASVSCGWIFAPLGLRWLVDPPFVRGGEPAIYIHAPPPLCIFLELRDLYSIPRKHPPSQLVLGVGFSAVCPFSLAPPIFSGPLNIDPPRPLHPAPPHSRAPASAASASASATAASPTSPSAALASRTRFRFRSFSASLRTSPCHAPHNIPLSSDIARLKRNPQKRI